MRSIGIIWLLTVLLGCQIDPPTHEVVLTHAKIRRIETKNGQEWIMIANNGEKLIPANWQEFKQNIVEDKEVQLVYTELPKTSSDSIVAGKSIQINHILHE